MIGREKEQKTLRDAFESGYSQFVAVYGRRRIGKTFLVRETFGYSFTFQHSGAANEPMKNQLSLFRDSLYDCGLEDCPALKTWHDAFNQLKRLIQKSGSLKKVVFLDEAAWMDTPKSHFLSALEHFWNGWASNRKDILLIICASATSWIINKVFRSRGGLHNRVTIKIPLYPFSLKECEQYCREAKLNMTRYQILNLYMIMGGVALYWTLLERQYSAVQNVDRLFFGKDAKLSGEFNDLYNSLFKHPEPYKEIITALDKHLSGLTRQELLERTSQTDNGSFSDRLEELEECGFIMKMRSFPKQKKESLYKLTDNFTIFYFKYIKENGRTEGFWQKAANTPSVRSWSGFAFERVCLQHVSQIKKAMGISGVAATEHSWRYIPEKGSKDVQGAQIDLLIDRADDVIDVCEMKWASSEYIIDKKYEGELRNKVSALCAVTGTRKAVHLIMVTTFGVSHNMYYDSIQSEITLDSLFE